jgi:triosephosphate isomerase (TIM)
VRKPFVAGNWKMNGIGDAAVALAQELVLAIGDPGDVDVAICPPFTSIAAVAECLEISPLEVGAQDMFWKESGAYTGKISAAMLRELGVRYVILGHSEARGRFGKPDLELEEAGSGDTDAAVRLKVRSAVIQGLLPILCVGETLAERQSGRTDEVVSRQIAAAIEGLSVSQVSVLTVAYEPVWAIGTGHMCDAAEANRVCGRIRGEIAQLISEEVARAMRIQYGGSVTADNAAELISHPHIDGALVGGQSLRADAFARIVHLARPA